MPPSRPWSRPASSASAASTARQQCRRLRARRPGRDERGGLGRPGRLQPQERVSDLQARAAGDGEAEDGRDRQRRLDLRHPLHRRVPGRLRRHQGRRDPALARGRGAIRGQGHPREHRGARAAAHADGGGAARAPARRRRRRGAAGAAPASAFRSALPATAATPPMPRCSSPPTKRASSPAPRSWSTAA